MKKLSFGIAFLACYIIGPAQTSVSPEQARSNLAGIMAAFTEASSFAYSKGITYDQFKLRLCGKAVPVYSGNLMIEEAYNYLNKGIGREQVLKENNGTAVAKAFKFLLDQHNKSVEPDGTELFGGKAILDGNATPVSKAGGCKWYQFWCLVQQVVASLFYNWNLIFLTLGPYSL